MLMTYKQLFALLGATGMSPEQFGNEVGLSGMTLRRWRSHAAVRKLAPVDVRRWRSWSARFGRW